MNYAEAIRISENPTAYTEEQVGTAIAVILSMCTINAVTKENLLNLIRYMFDMCYEVKRNNLDYFSEHCFTVRECEKCGELYEPFCELKHICKRQNSYPKEVEG